MWCCWRPCACRALSWCGRICRQHLAGMQVDQTSSQQQLLFLLHSMLPGMQPCRCPVAVDVAGVAVCWQQPRQAAVCL